MAIEWDKKRRFLNSFNNPSTSDDIGLLFWAPLSDAGAGVVRTTLGRGSGSATFTRATTAMTVLSTGLLASVASGSPRSYYDPTTLQYLGYLSEEARTNICLQSTDLSNATWTKNASTIGGSVTAPDGSVSTVSKIQEDNTTAQHYLRQNIVKAASALVYTYSVFLKSAERSAATLRMDDGAGNGYFVSVNLSTNSLGAATLVGAGWTSGSATITVYPGGWVRATLTATSNSATTVSTLVMVENPFGTQSYTGVTGSGIYAWGIQLEQAAFATSYIPTTTVSVTRNADVLTYPTNGNVLGTAGSTYAEVTWATVSSGTDILSTFTTTEGILSQFDGSGNVALYDGTGSRVPGPLAGTSNLVTPKKIATTWAGANTNGASNGVAGTPAAFDGDMSISATLNIMRRGNGSSYPNGTIKNVKIWNRALSTLELQTTTR